MTRLHPNHTSKTTNSFIKDDTNSKLIIFKTGCLHELCTQCALYLCCTNNTSSSPHAPPGSVPCPLCRNGIISFKKLTTTKPLNQLPLKHNTSLSCCSCSSVPRNNTPSTPETIPLSKQKPNSHSLRSHKFQVLKLENNVCVRGTDTIASIVRRSHINRYSRSSFRWSSSHVKGRRYWLCSLNQSVEAPDY